jgi:hypothetical protein
MPSRLPPTTTSMFVFYYNHVFELGLSLRVDEACLCDRLCDYFFYLGLFIA